MREAEAIEQLAVRLYADDGYALAIYTPEESWPKDRENVRERYRRLARIKLGVEGDTQ